MAALLQLDRVTIRFGGLTAVSELNLAIGDNDLVGLIGPNGAGKTTAFNFITGVYQPTSGTRDFQRPETPTAAISKPTNWRASASRARFRTSGCLTA